MSKTVKTRLGAVCLALLLMCVIVVSMGVSAEAADSDFTIENGVLTKYNGSGGAVVIPDGVTSIGKNAFSSCKSLTNITIPTSVTRIEDYAFSSCKGLTSLTLPNSVTSLGVGAFLFCDGLTSVTLPNSITSFGRDAFLQCKNLESVTIQDGATLIGEKAFSGCKKLTSVTIPNSVTTIETSAFSECSGLANITLPSGLTKLRGILFANCKNLASITIPGSVKEIEGRAFEGCEKLKSVVIPAGVTSIPNLLFRNCLQLENVTIPDSVTHIGSYAFDSCYKLENLAIPSSVTSFGVHPFDSTPFLKKLGEMVIINHVFVQYRGGDTNVVIPGDVIAIGGGAFMNHTYVKSVTIPASVTRIGEQAFMSCPSLTNVNIPASVTRFGVSAFAETPFWDQIAKGDFVLLNHVLLRYQGSDANVIVPNGTTRIDEGAFSMNRNLTSVTVPASVTSIGNAAFANCIKLTNLTIPNNVTEIHDNAFQHLPSGPEDFNTATKTIHGVAGSYVEQWVKQVTAKKPEYVAEVTFIADQTAQPGQARPSGPLAYASTQTVQVDGKPVQLQMYALKDASGNKTNYVKVRDIAHVLNGTAAQFNVTWDGAVNLISKTAYVPNGSEMATPYTGDRAYKKATASTKVNGAVTNLEAITLTDDQGGGYTYYKLRDLGNALGFTVGWSKEQGVYIQTQ